RRVGLLRRRPGGRRRGPPASGHSQRRKGRGVRRLERRLQRVRVGVGGPGVTPYTLLLQACGLSQREAASLHGVRLDTIKSWSAGRNRVPDGVIDQLRDLFALIVEVGEQAIDTLAAAPDTADIEIGYPADDHEAQTL